MNVVRIISSLGLAAMAFAMAPSSAHAAAPSIPLESCQPPSLMPSTGVIRVRPVAQVRHLDLAEVTFQGRTTLDGGFELEARGGTLTFRKTSRPDGQFTLELEAPGDKVTIGMNEAGLSIVRNKRRVTVTFDARQLQSLDAARALLADSPAVNLTRIAAAAVEGSEDDSAASAGFLIGDALIGALSGDPGAPARVARHLSRHARNGIRRIATGEDCYGIWESRVLRASYEIGSCTSSFSVWNPTRSLCVFRWVLQVESYWFSFLSCSGFSKF